MFEIILDRIKDPIEFTSFKVFQFLGYLFGGIGPVIIFFMIELYGWEQNVMESQYIGRFLLLTLFGAFVGIVAFYIEHAYHEVHLLFRLFFFLQAIFSVVFIHLLVAFSGGPTASIFSFSYLYLPAVVGFCYGKGFKLWVASFFLCISFIINILWLQQNQMFFSDYLVSGKSFVNNDITHKTTIVGNKIIYVTTFIIQLIVTIAIASKRKSEKQIEEKTQDENENSIN